MSDLITDTPEAREALADAVGRLMARGPLESPQFAGPADRVPPSMLYGLPVARTDVAALHARLARHRAKINRRAGRKAD